MNKTTWKPVALLLAQSRLIAADVAKARQTIATKGEQVEQAKLELAQVEASRPVVVDVEADAAADALLADPKRGFTANVMARFRSRTTDQTLSDWQAQVAGLRAAIKRGLAIIAETEAALPGLSKDQENAQRAYRNAAFDGLNDDLRTALKEPLDKIIMPMGGLDQYRTNERIRVFEPHWIKSAVTGESSFSMMRQISPGDGSGQHDAETTRALAAFEAELLRLMA